MADQIINVKCGFFDAINNDRTYSADQMNLPYKRIVANGVFATPAGTPSTDLQVVSAGNGMNITVSAGNGIFADKWFENSSNITITVPDNTNISPRRDSVIIQVDKRSSGRVGNIVYRMGIPSSDPQAPAINTVTNVTEYRLANIYVAPSADTINNDAIVDLRGSSSCPWVTSLIQQVDTSTLYTQWQTAYQNYYNQTTEDIAEYMEEQEETWQQFLQTAIQDLQLAAYIELTSTYTTTGTSTTTIPINIPSYKPSTDILQVYINGLMAAAGEKYTVNSEGTNITLTNALASGQTVYFVVLHAILGTDLDTAVTLINQVRADLSNAENDIADLQNDVSDLQNDVSDLQSDSGWITFTLENLFSAVEGQEPAVRKVGNNIYIRGEATTTQSGTNNFINITICTLPTAYRPAIDHYYSSTIWHIRSSSEVGVAYPVTLRVGADGYIQAIASSDGGFTTTSRLVLTTSFPLG